MSLMPPPPPPMRHKFEGSGSKVLVTRQKVVPVEIDPNKIYTQSLTITGFLQQTDMTCILHQVDPEMQT